MEEKSQQSEAQMYVHGTFSLLMLDVTCTSVLVAVGCSSTVVYSYRELSELRSIFDNSENCCASWTLKWTSSEVIRMKMVVAVCRSSSQFFRVRTRTSEMVPMLGSAMRIRMLFAHATSVHCSCHATEGDVQPCVEFLAGSSPGDAWLSILALDSYCFLIFLPYN
jgi:hypothetical protein